MIRLSKVRTVASFEFLTTIKRKGYLITTFGMPIFMLLYGGIVSIPAHFISKKESQVKVYGVIDRAGILGLDEDVTQSAGEMSEEIRAALGAAGQVESFERALRWKGNLIFRPYDREDEAREALFDDRIKGYYRLKEDFLETGVAELFLLEGVNLGAKGSRAPLRNLLLDRLLEGNVREEIVERVRKPIAQWKEWMVTPTGEIMERNVWSVLARIVVPILFAILLLMSVMMSAGYLIQATAIEKENKVVEVLLSSAEPHEILAGKLLGLGTAGLLQVIVWFSMVIAAAVAFASTLTLLGIEVPWAAIAVGLVFFVAAYLFVGSLMLGTGSLGSNMRESQQMSVMWSLLTAVPLMFVMILIEEPQGTLAQILTWIPFTASTTVMLRMTLDLPGIAWWEIAGSFLVLVASTWLAIRFGARLFRVGLLLTGARPKLREILRQARLSA